MGISVVKSNTEIRLTFHEIMQEDEWNRFGFTSVEKSGEGRVVRVFGRQKNIQIKVSQTQMSDQLPHIFCCALKYTKHKCLFLC